MIVKSLLANMTTIYNGLILNSSILSFYCSDTISPGFSHSNTNNAFWNKRFTLPIDTKFVFKLCE